MSRPSLPLAVAESIRRAVSRGLSIRKAAKEFQLSRNSVRKYLRNKDVTDEKNSSGGDARRDAVSRGG
jgi:transposase